MAELNRFAVNDEDHYKFGILVKKWARGQLPMPHRNLKMFKDQLLDEGIGVRWPEGPHRVIDIEISPTHPNVLHFTVPPLSFIEETEAVLKDSDYPLPSYYDTLFNASADPNRLPQDALDSAESPNNALHNYRIGDYTVANCA